MRIVILTVDHVYANKVVKDLILKYGSEVKLIVESDCLYYNKSLFESLKKYYDISGLYYIIVQALKLQIYKYLSLIITKFNLGSVSSKFYHFEKCAEVNKVPVKKIFNINSDLGLKVLKKYKPDLIVSVLFNQLLGKSVISLPAKGVINIHPAYLPDYKGVSPVFWALANSEENVGVSVHYINQGIDTGQILARKRLRIERKDTEDSLYLKLVKVGSPLLIGVIDKLKARIKINKIVNTKGRYFSLPTKKAVKKYLKKRKSFFNLSDYLFTS